MALMQVALPFTELTEDRGTIVAVLPWQAVAAGLAHKGGGGSTAGRSTVEDLEHREIVGQLGDAAHAGDPATEGAAHTVNSVSQQLLQTLPAHCVTTLQEFGSHLVLVVGLQADGAFENLPH